MKTSATQPAQQTRPTRVRHIVLWLTVAAYMITYMDRVVISAAATEIQRELGFSLITMGTIMSSFYLGYALFQIPGGWLGDRIGPRRALSLIVLWWSVFTSLTAAAWNATSMIVFRFLFGAGEAGAFPIATRSLSRWMLPDERGWAQGVTHAGSRLGAAATPPIVAMLIVSFGWRAPFLVFGMLGVAWAALWYWYYRDTPEEHRSVNDAERDQIHKSMGGPRTRVSRSVPWRSILGNRTMWFLSAMYFCYGYCLAIYIVWFPTYLRDYRGFTLKEMGFYAALPLLAGTAGDLFGGWFSDLMLKRTGNLTASRRWVAFSGFLIATAGIIPATLTADAVTCVIFTCLAVFGLETTVGVSWAVPLDIGGDFAGSASAVMNTCGNIGGTISPMAAAYLATAYGWSVAFLVPSVLCVAAAMLYLKIDAGRKIFPAGA